MKNITLKLSAFALGAATLSMAGAATVSTHASGVRATAAAYFGQGAKPISLQTYDVTDGSSVFLALCVDPVTPMQRDSRGAYSNGGEFTLFKNNDTVARLYSNFYSGITGDTAAAKTDSLAFQLALWEVYSDDSNLTATTGQLYFDWSVNNPAGKAVLNRAAEMVSYAADTNNAIVTRYDFTKFESTGSQTIVNATVSAVPEPSTYAMLGLGMAVVGFAARRRAKR